MESSCVDLIRASMSLFRPPQGVGGRDKPGQDEISRSFCSVIRPQDFPRTALRESGNPGDLLPYQLPLDPRLRGGDDTLLIIFAAS
jgi:hypothetical protein